MRHVVFAACCLAAACGEDAAEVPPPIEDGIVLAARVDLPTMGGADATLISVAGNWGWTSPDGRRLALTTTSHGLSIVEVSDPERPRRAGFIAGPLSRVREVKTYRHYAYVTVDDTSATGPRPGSGLDIIDLSDPSAPRKVRTWTRSFVNAHTLWIDEARGRLYAHGSDAGLRILDLTQDPEDPTDIGGYTDFYVHDSYAHGTDLWAAVPDFQTGYIIVLDAADPARVRERGRFECGRVTHSTWVTADGRHVFTTQEWPGFALRAWDISDLAAPRVVGAFIAEPNSMPHNIMLDGNRLVVAHYTEGVQLVDVCDVTNLRGIGAYVPIPDHRPPSFGAGLGSFVGAWSAYIFPGSTLIVASDNYWGLLVLRVLDWAPRGYIRRVQGAPPDPKKTIDPLERMRVGPPTPVAAKLVVVSGVDQGLEVALDTVVEVGTDPGCHMVLHDPSVSRHHLVAARVGGVFRVQDRGSRNGTFLGGTRIVEADIPLGTVLTLGDSSIALRSRWYVREVQPSAARRFGEVLAESIRMREIFAILERVAPSGVTVLVEGESGTGKELVARSIHAGSGRAGHPYVVFDCGAVPRELAESELFGHRRGAFSGAVADRAGAFQRADGGTICLDEIGELPLDLQPKLLRVLETGEFRPVGDDVMRKVDVRVIAATNRDLHAEMARGRFRADLLYRLDCVRLHIPPLRQRPEDIPGLVGHFLQAHLPPGDPVGGDNLGRLVAYTWPGNVRELRNTLMRAVALALPPVSFAQLVFNLGPAPEQPSTIGMSFPGVSPPLPYKEAKGQLLASFERAYLEGLLERHHGNVTQAAAAAGLSRKHLHELIRRVNGDVRGDGGEDSSG